MVLIRDVYLSIFCLSSWRRLNSTWEYAPLVANFLPMLRNGKMSSGFRNLYCCIVEAGLFCEPASAGTSLYLVLLLNKRGEASRTVLRFRISYFYHNFLSWQGMGNSEYAVRNFCSSSASTSGRASAGL